MFVLAQYLGWVEILCRDIGFLDLGDQRRNRRLVELLSVIRRVLFATDLDPVFHVPAGHQRAVGELMIESDHATPGQGRCIGLATFCKRLDHDSYFASWFERIEAGIVEYAHHPEQGGNRLVELNARLSDLIEFLDPDLTRFPLRQEERSRYLPPRASDTDPGPPSQLSRLPLRNQSLCTPSLCTPSVGIIELTSRCPYSVICAVRVRVERGDHQARLGVFCPGRQTVPKNQCFVATVFALDGGA